MNIKATIAMTAGEIIVGYVLGALCPGLYDEVEDLPRRIRRHMEMRRFYRQ